ncbi:MAG: DUF434 domain-containing protein, partial [Deltaproteobacteria bacterium]|nr:DUF434 domain-containing protein [Deltaproteobacteria bacterium]
MPADPKLRPAGSHYQLVKADRELLKRGVYPEA